MAEKIKKFFAKKKTDAKFKLAGPGHRLDSDSSSTVSASSKNSKTAYAPQKSVPSEAKRQAAEAALSRLQNQKKDSPFNTSLAAIQAQVRKELESERKELDACQQGVTQAPVLCEMEASPLLAVKGFNLLIQSFNIKFGLIIFVYSHIFSGVYFRCPIISEEVLSKEEWRDKIKEFLMEQLEEERGLTACLMIHSCNYNKTKVTECVNVISKYLENIIANPQELKFHKIRCSNNTYREKVEPILGATDLLFAAGFRQEILANNDVNEQFWVFNESNIEGLETLEVLLNNIIFLLTYYILNIPFYFQFLRDALRSEDRIELIIDRNLQVLSPAQAAKRVELPSDFYALTPDDLKKEQQVK